MEPQICMVVDYMYPDVGGVQTHTLHLARHLIQKGVDVFIVTRQLKGTGTVEEVEGVPFYRTPVLAQLGKVGKSVTFTTEALRLMFKFRHRYQIIHSHKVISPATIGLLGRDILRKKLIINPHSTSMSGAFANLIHHRPVHGRLRLAWMGHRADRFVAISHQVKNDLLSVGVPSDKIVFIPNGIETDKFIPLEQAAKSTRRQTLNLPDKLLVIFTGRLASVKQVDILLKAWHTVVQHQPQAHLLILGDGPERLNLEQLAGELGITATVKFLGSVNNVADYLQCGDLFILPSESEAMPVALLEAMACGLPVVASKVGGILDIVKDNLNGKLVESGNVEDLHKTVVNLLDNAHLRQKMGRQARTDVVTNYSLEYVSNRFIELYQGLL